MQGQADVPCIHSFRAHCQAQASCCKVLDMGLGKSACVLTPQGGILSEVDDAGPDQQQHLHLSAHELDGHNP